MFKKSFFNLGTGDTLDSINQSSKKKRIGCDLCGLHRNCISPKMKISGKGEKKILIVGEAPGRSEDEKGVPFIGRAGELLINVLTDLGIHMRQDCKITNAVICRPKDNKTPSSVQIGECRHRLLKEIEEYKPKVIILLGASAVQSILGHRLKGRLTSIRNTAFFSEQIPDQEYKCWICPTYHPAHLLYNENDKVLKKIWKEDLRKAIELVENNTKFPEIDIENNCFLTESYEETMKWLKNLLERQPSYMVFDYETTGVKPHRLGHEIVCASVAANGQSYAFPFFHNEGEFEELWCKILTSKNIGKIAHKIDFENIWTHVRAGGFWIPAYWVSPWVWDTCIASHCLDNKKSTSLKFQIYVNFGIIGYDTVDKYIRGLKAGEDKKSNNKFNIIHEAPTKELLYYSALDSYFTMKLYEKQKEELKDHQLEGFKFFLSGIDCFSKIEQQGMKVNIDKMNLEFNRLEKRNNLLEENIMESKEAEMWEKKKKKKLNFNSNMQLADLLYNMLGYKVPEEGGKTDIKALEKIELDFVKDILQYRKYKKMKDTYLAQYRREQVDGILRPFFNLHLANTFRSSSDSPNFQNVPKRDERSKKIIRSIIVPTFRNRLIEYDYKGIEVCIAACYNQDPMMIKYILDPTTDMHRDIAIDLFFRTKETFTKKERYLAKNGFVFPSFYGSTSMNIAPNIWNEMEKETKNHLKEKGIRTFKDFESHVEDIEDKFWNERFVIYQEWKERFIEEYEEKGYLDLYTGFRCYGPIKQTKVTNYPIQGSAFHCLLWTLINVQDKIEKISGRSKVIGQIHDAIVLDAHPEDEEEIDKIIKLYGTEKIREYWDWIIVPLKIEKERSEINGDWSDMKEVGIL